MSLVHIDERKWIDRLHWQFDASLLGEDRYGVWLHVPASTVARRGEDPPRELGHGFVGCIPTDDWWVIEFYWDHPWHEVYVNIGTPPAWEGERMIQVDLDLDVVRRVDGSVEVLDEDEFAIHQECYGYPDVLIDGARVAANRAEMMLQTGTEPFGAAAVPWFEMIGVGRE